MDEIGTQINGPWYKLLDEDVQDLHRRYNIKYNKKSKED